MPSQPPIEPLDPMAQIESYISTHPEVELYDGSQPMEPNAMNALSVLLDESPARVVDYYRYR